MRLILVTCLVTALLTIGASASFAASITDGALVIDIESDGEFNQITLNGTPIDTSGFMQRQYFQGASLGGGSAVVVDGAQAVYTASSGTVSFEVVSTILGPLGGDANTSLFRQQFFCTNNGTGSASLDLVSFMDPDVGDTTSNTTWYDAATNSVAATNGGGTPTLMAATATGGAYAWHVAGLGDLGTKTSWNLNRAVGPVGVSDIEMAVGLGKIRIAPGVTHVMTFDYLFATNTSQVPPGFGNQVPEPSTFALAGLGLLGLGFVVRRRRNR